MDILQQCQIWNENNEHKKIIDALESISGDKRTPEIDSELARAYANAADPYEPEGREMLKRAVTLLKPHEEYFAWDHCWNFRMGYAYFYLEQEGQALQYFENALEARLGDEDTEEFIEACKARMTFPQFSECFRERTESAWEKFAEQEKELRRIMDEDKNHRHGDELVEKCENIFNLAFYDVSFEIGFNGEKYELIFTPEGDKVKLFELVYFHKHAPKSLLEHWNFIVGRQANENFGLRIDDIDINGDDVQVWVEQIEEENLGLSVYCKKLIPLLEENEDKVWWMLTTITDQILGELSQMRYIYSFDILESEKDEEAILLSKLPEKIKSMGFDLINNAEDYLESYIGYGMEPVEDPEADWRLDTIAGSTSCAALINGYLSSDNDFIDELHADGTVAGFFCYPLDILREEEGSDKIFDFRDQLEEVLASKENAEILRVIGGATGVYCGYVDFIAWDIRSALNVGKEFFEKSNLPWAAFHTFRRNAGTVMLKEGCSELDDTLTGVDYIPYTPDTAEEFYDQIEKWNDEDEYIRCIQAINAIPEEWCDYRCKYVLARALENYAVIGEHDEGTPKDKGDEALEKAIEVLESVREEGENKAEWNMRMAYGYQYLYGQEEKAISYAKRWAELDPDDENATMVIDECKAEIKKRKRFLTCKKYQFVPGKVPFEDFDFNDFWDDSEYALKEYVSEPPTDELIASIEEELGYKLPESYIGLMKQHNGGIPKNTCYPTEEPTCWAEDHIAITGIMGIGRDKDCSLCGSLGSQFMIDEWEYPAIGIAICDCPSAGHDMIFLDYRECGPQGEPKVVHVDQENDYKITPLADSFEEFICGLENEEFFDDDDEDIENFGEPEVYTEEEMTAVEQHIQQYFGKFDNVFHELVSPDIHVDICVVPPTEERDYYTLITMGMGAHQMNVPNELAEYKLERAELAIAVPEDWKLDNESMQDERWYWPIRLLKSLARLPIDCDSWLGNGHTVENREPFADNTKLCTAILISPQGTEEGSEICTLPSGEEVNFYQIIPLYSDELDYKLKHDADALLEKMVGISFVVKPDRQDAIIRGTLSDDDFDGEMDDAYYHIESIEEKELQIDTITAYNHMAIYLRWCMEHDLMGSDFLKEYGEVVQKVKNGSADVDLREFIRDELDGCLFSVMFNKKGRMFAGYYYGEGDSPYYPADIDDNAFRYFGSEKYHSDEFQDEAYLFVPFDEDYYMTMAEIIEERFENWQGQSFDEDTLEPSEVADAIMEYLGCECTYFPSMADDDPIMSAYSYAARNSSQKGYIPVLIKPDETLLECLVMNSDPENDDDCYEFNLKTVAEYRKEMLAASVKDGKEVLEHLTGTRREEAVDDGLNWEEDVLEEMEKGFSNNRFSSYWNSETDMTYPLILAKIPVKNPWEVFSYLPFGGWNECPDTEELMAAAKYWFEKYGAVPAVMTHDELEFNLPEPAGKEDAMELAIEQYGFCPDMDQNFEQIGALADTLWQSNVWYFWWD